MRHPRWSPTYCTAEDNHVHTCRACSTSWEHPRGGGPDVKTEEAHIAAHTCPKCGVTEYYKTKLTEVKQIDFPWSNKGADE